MTVLGHWVVLVALFASVGSGAAYLRAARRNGRAPRTGRSLLHVSALSVVIASALLVALLLTHDFSNGYVYSYSDRSLPLHFLLSSFYAGQEGSFLFWALCSSIISLVLCRVTARRGSEAWIMTVSMGVQAMLLLLVTVKTPFTFLWEMFPQVSVGTVPDDGRGLNPLLQNFWMVIHPPVLFLGFASLAVPFSYAIAALWKKDYTLLVVQGLPWALTGSAVLGLGIMLGGYWAYGVLGWGGYWGWDPVENSSLIPWLISIALVHTLVVQLRTSKYLRTNLLLAIAAFFFVIYSTFLTRSGILGDASVHSFTDPGASVYWILLGVLAVIALSGVGMMLLRRKELVPPPPARTFLTRETALGAGVLVLLLSALVTLFGTSLPIFSTTRVEPSFYDTANLPIAIVMGLLIGFSLTMQWELEDAIGVLRRSWKTLLAALIATIILVIVGVRDPLMAAFAFTALFAFAVNVETGIRVAKGDPRFLGGKIAHIGVACFFLGIISTGRYSASEHVVLPLDAPREVLGYTMTYTGQTPLPDKKFAFNVAVRRGEDTLSLAPVMFEAGQQGVMRNPDIASMLTRDIYLSPVSLQPGAPDGGREEHSFVKGEPVTLREVQATFTGFDMADHAGSMGAEGGGMTIGAVLELTRGTARERVVPVMRYRPDQPPEYTNVRSQLLDAEVQLTWMNVGSGTSPSTVAITLFRGSQHQHGGESLVVEASVKPYINLIWGGTMLMMVGFLLAILKRFKEV